MLYWIVGLLVQATLIATPQNVNVVYYQKKNTMFLHKAKDVYSCLLSKFIMKLITFWLDSMELYGILTEHFCFVIGVQLCIREYLVLVLRSEEIWLGTLLIFVCRYKLSNTI